MKFWLAVAATITALDVCAQDAATSDALEWLRKIADSSRTVSYSGTFVYQHGSRVETSRVVHYVNQAGGVFEKLETLDGPPREVIRANDHVTAYIPDAKVVLVERRSTRHLPVMLPEKLSDLTQQYDVKKLEADRMGGYECVWIGVIPKDKLRYGRKFCAERGSGLPLRAQVFNERMEIIESFGFSQLSLGGKFSRDQVASRYEGRSQAQKWRVDRSALNVMEQAADTGWTAVNLPQGFRKSMEVKRTIAGRPVAMPHLVYSDGLAAISVFVEPKVREVSAKPLTSQGAVHIYKRAYGEHIVTVLGEAPAATVMQIANSMEHRNVGSAFPK
ncbi:MAG TPA: MucB/RseB C-terminal domain-containing protein [Burkholderiales bacterium]|nr:MucB/RseB C-terminal domain-containing protein [Burkholderiales bacterium]